jgi:biotin carboxyl carrier protein
LVREVGEGARVKRRPKESALGRTYTLSVDDRFAEAEVWEDGQSFFVKLRGVVHEVSLNAIDDGRLFSLLVDGHSYEVHTGRQPGGYNILVGSEVYRIGVERGHRRTHIGDGEAQAGSSLVRSPMTGMVTQVEVSPGTAVARGAVMLTLESMKMNNELKATRDAVVERVLVEPGKRVERGDALLELKSAD